MSLAKIEALTFDLGYTLIYPDPPAPQVYSELAKQAGINVDESQVKHGFKQVWQKLGFDRFSRDYALDESVARPAWYRLIELVFAEQGITQLPISLYKTIYDYFGSSSAWALYPTALALLDELAHHRVRLGLISNFDPRIHRILQGLKLEPYFEVKAISCDLGYVKPEPEIFAAACKEFDLEPEKILHVGDNLIRDYEGARACGLQARLIQHHQNIYNDREISLEIPTFKRLIHINDK